MNDKVIHKLKERLLALLTEEEKELHHLIIYIEHNQPEESKKLAKAIENHLESIKHLEIKVNTDHHEDDIIREIDVLHELLDRSLDAIDPDKDADVETELANLVTEMRHFKIVVKKHKPN